MFERRFNPLLREFFVRLHRGGGAVRLALHHGNEEVVGLLVEKLETFVHAPVEQVGGIVREKTECREVIIGRKIELNIVPQVAHEGFCLLFVLDWRCALRRVQNLLRKIFVHSCVDKCELQR